MTFQEFVQSAPLCQFLTQEHRIESWIRSVLCDDDLDDKPLVEEFKHGFQGRNIHSQHLLAYMRVPKDPTSGIKEASYTFMERDPSVSFEELLLQQSIQGKEFKWHQLATDWRVFPYSLDFLLSLISVYFQPLKLLAMMSNLSIYNTFARMQKASELQYEEKKESKR